MVLQTEILGREQDGPVTYFNVRVVEYGREGERQTFVRRRFSEFRELDLRLSGRMEISRIKLPHRNLFGFRRKFNINRFNERRQAALDQYLSHLVRQVRSLNDNAALAEFLQPSGADAGIGGNCMPAMETCTMRETRSASSLEPGFATQVLGAPVDESDESRLEVLAEEHDEDLSWTSATSPENADRPVHALLSDIRAHQMTLLMQDEANVEPLVPLTGAKCMTMQDFHAFIGHQTCLKEIPITNISTRGKLLDPEGDTDALSTFSSGRSSHTPSIPRSYEIADDDDFLACADNSDSERTRASSINMCYEALSPHWQRAPECGSYYMLHSVLEQLEEDMCSRQRDLVMAVEAMRAAKHPVVQCPVWPLQEQLRASLDLCSSQTQLLRAILSADGSS